jgi:hypothetical protein
MSEELLPRLLNWLRQTGYPFQLHAGRGLNAAGWHVNYSRWYKDPESDKYRELDLQAITGAVQLGSASLFLNLCIECKVVVSKPWIGLSSRKDGGGRSFVASAPGLMSRRFAFAAQLLEVALPILVSAETTYVDSIVAGYTPKADKGSNKNKPSARAIAQPDPTSPHSALMQAVSAAKAYDSELLGIAITALPELATATIVLPVVLIRGRLFVYTVDEELRDDLSEVGSCLVSVPTENEDKSTLVAVLTEDFAAQAWPKMYSAAHDFCQAALPYATRIANALTMSEREMPGRI